MVLCKSCGAITALFWTGLLLAAELAEAGWGQRVAGLNSLGTSARSRQHRRSTLEQQVQTTALRQEGERAWVELGSHTLDGANAVDVSLRASPTSGEVFWAYSADEGAVIHRLRQGRWRPAGSWENGSASVIKSLAPSLGFALGPDGTAYFASRDDAVRAGTASVLSLAAGSSGKWSPLGHRGFLDRGVVDYAVGCVLEVAPNGTPHLAYRDPTDSSHVMRYHNGEWEELGGAAGFESGHAASINLAFQPGCGATYADDCTPHVAYLQPWPAMLPVVKRLEGGAWVEVGPPLPMQQAAASSIRLAFSAAGNPVVAISSGAEGAERVTLLELVAGQWVHVGDFAGEQPQLAVTPDGRLYLSLVHGPTSCLSVLSLSPGPGSEWQAVGAQEFSPDWVREVSLAVGQDGWPLVAFQAPNEEGFDFGVRVMAFQ